MVAPLIAGAISVGASFLPAIVSAIIGAKTKEEASAAVRPQRNAFVAQMVGRGMSPQEAEAKADKEIEGALAEKMQEGAIPPWAEAALGLVSGIGAAGALKAFSKGAKAAGLKAPFAKSAQSPAKSNDALDPIPGDKKPTLPRQMPAEVDVSGPRTRSQPLDDGSDLIPSSAPERGVIGLRHPFMADIGSATSGRATRPVRPLDVRNSDQLRLPFAPRRLGYSPQSMPTEVYEERLMELAQHARRTPKRPRNAGIVSDIGLPFDEAAYIDDLMRVNPQGY